MDLETGEQVIFSGHPSWRSILGFYLKGLLLVAVVVALAVLIGDGAGIVVAAGAAALALLLLGGWLKRLATTYTITSKRLHIRRGIIAREEQHALVNRIQNVNTDQSVLERLLQIGTVDFDTSAGGDYDFRFSGVADPAEVVDAVHTAQRQADAERSGERVD